jgi:hypothetical protein
MKKKHYPALPKAAEKGLDAPFDGMFGNSAYAYVLAEIVADPYSDYRPKDLEELTGLTAPSVRMALNHFVKTGILEKDSSNRQHPVFRPNLSSKRLRALTMLAYAIIDDRDKSHHMDEAIGSAVEDGARAVDDSRVYMSHRAAQMLAQALDNLLDQLKKQVATEALKDTTKS